MTGKEIVTDWWITLYPDQASRFNIGYEHEMLVLAKNIDAALAAERERCVKVVRDNPGKCVSDASCEALVEEIRTP